MDAESPQSLEASHSLTLGDIQPLVLSKEKTPSTKWSMKTGMTVDLKEIICVYLFKLNTNISDVHSLFSINTEV